jgi:hypothetical protein
LEDRFDRIPNGPSFVVHAGTVSVGNLVYFGGLARIRKVTVEWKRPESPGAAKLPFFEKGTRPVVFGLVRVLVALPSFSHGYCNLSRREGKKLAPPVLPS